MTGVAGTIGPAVTTRDGGDGGDGALGAGIIGGINAGGVAARGRTGGVKGSMPPAGMVAFVGGMTGAGSAAAGDSGTTAAPGYGRGGVLAAEASSDFRNSGESASEPG